MNSEEKNYTAIDLGDNLKELSFQVTSTTKLSKVRKTLEKYKDEYGYKKVIMLYATMDKPTRSVDLNDEVGDRIEVEEWCIKDLCERIMNLDDERILKIQKIIHNQINPNIYDNYLKKTDDTASEDWDNLEQKDIRNFADKINDVNSNINEFRVIKYSRDIASGEAELSKFSEREVRAMKYRIFEVCQDELIEFCEINDTTKQIDIKLINGLINKYTEKASSVIEEKSKDYSYPLKNKDLLRKVVLALINDCYLSFDEKGIYI